MSAPSFRQKDFIEVCAKCRTNCCCNARPPLTQRRIEIIQSHLQIRGIVPKLNQGEYSFPEEYPDGYCSLLDANARRCGVHEVKPETCVAGPITFDIDRRTGKIEWYLKTEEICPLAGILAKDRSLLLEHLSSARRELLRLVSELESSELTAILRIEEESTI
jgi:Fe-S-cluster containining protein